MSLPFISPGQGCWRGRALRVLHRLFRSDPRPVISPVALPSYILTFDLLGQPPVRISLL